jgi:hypothetical protein
LISLFAFSRFTQSRHCLSSSSQDRTLTVPCLFVSSYFLFFGTLSALVVLIYFYFIETSGLSLEEVQLLFDNSDVVTAYSLNGRKEAVDAELKYGMKHRSVQHFERKGSEEDSSV